jgi:hypothetical protein
MGVTGAFQSSHPNEESMQKRLLLPLATLSLFVGLMTACDSTSSNSGPSITNLYLDNTSLSAGGGSTGIHATVADPNKGIQVNFKVVQNGTDVSSDFTISYTAPSSSVTSWSAFNDGSAKISAVSGATNGNDTLVMTVTDASGSGTATQRVPVTVTGGVNGGGSTATQSYTGSVYDVNGPNKGAFDLINNTGVSASSSDATKDLKDITAVGTVFDGSLSSGNGATFVKAPSSFVFTGATVESITAAFNAGTPSTTISTPSVGDVWLVKTSRSGTVTYIALQFTVVHAESASSSANDGYVTFTYLM